MFRRQSWADADLPVFDKPLSKITYRNGPYHLINAALNVEESKTANRRGRNADFFLFSPLFVGSKSTGYVATADVEQVAFGFDLATAMAVSGAAVSSSMGAQSIKPLTATLALLNIRLGYWLRNPLRLAKRNLRTRSTGAVVGVSPPQQYVRQLLFHRLNCSGCSTNAANPSI